MKWKRLWKELPLLEKFRIDRWLGTDDTSSHLELHGFADASKRGYAAVVYLQFEQSSQDSPPGGKKQGRADQTDITPATLRELCAAACQAYSCTCALC